MARRKRAQVEEEEEAVVGVSPAQPLVWSVAAIGAAFILYNILLAQPPEAQRLAGAGAEASRNTVILKYEPQVEEVQRELLATGHYRGLVDGVNGQRTRDAIAAYQRDNKLPEEPRVTLNLLEHIRYTRKIAAASEFTGSTEPTGGTPKNRIGMVQEALASLGYQPGDITGAMNVETRAALKRFEQGNGLPPDGEIDRAVLVKLSRTTGFESLAQ
jgi:peptidoglycan hydrolase-like protein with peptidoglycan-binding domain